jgi:hypothetical protein
MFSAVEALDYRAIRCIVDLVGKLADWRAWFKVPDDP